MSELVRRPPEGEQERSGEELYEEALRFAHQVAVKEPVQVDPADRSGR